MISPKTYYKATKIDNDYPIILGYTYIEYPGSTPRFISMKGNKAESNHSQLHFSDKDIYKFYAWRYIPLVKTIYWWYDIDIDQEKPTLDIIERTKAYLATKYKVTPLFSKGMSWIVKDTENSDQVVQMNKAALHITHGDEGIDRDAKLPSFKQWLKWQLGESYN